MKKSRNEIMKWSRKQIPKKRIKKNYFRGTSKHRSNLLDDIREYCLNSEKSSVTKENLAQHFQVPVRRISVCLQQLYNEGIIGGKSNITRSDRKYEYGWTPTRYWIDKPVNEEEKAISAKKQRDINVQNAFHNSHEAFMVLRGCPEEYNLTPQEHSKIVKVLIADDRVCARLMRDSQFDLNSLNLSNAQKEQVFNDLLDSSNLDNAISFVKRIELPRKLKEKMESKLVMLTLINDLR